jgi:peptidoglycan/xylan/chitin deacetylase (PgdA/CDA1 family)
MTRAPGRFAYAPIIDRPIIRPGNARVAFWVAPNTEFLEYMPESKPTRPDVPFYARMDYGNRVGFWRMLEVLNKHEVRACCCLNLEILDPFPEIKDAMVAANWDYMARGLYNSRPIYDFTEEQERAYWQDFVAHLKAMTGERLKGRLGGGAGYTVRTDDLMAEAACLYHTSWIIDNQPRPINVRGSQKFIYVPYTHQTNDAGILAWNREADHFLQMIKVTGTINGSAPKVQSRPLDGARRSRWRTSGRSLRGDPAAPIIRVGCMWNVQWLGTLP